VSLVVGIHPVHQLENQMVLSDNMQNLRFKQHVSMKAISRKTLQI
jgi:hypothetical protein